MHAGWWRREGALLRFVSDLFVGELGRLRPGRPARPGPWHPDWRLEVELNVDSLERVHLATALGEAIHLHRSGIDDALLAQATLADWVAVAARSLDAYSAEVTFKTSGSTGHPKWCVHALADLESEVEEHAANVAGTKRIVSAVPSHHIYGFLFTLLLPAQLGVEAIDVRAYAPAQLATLIRPGDLVIGHPDYWAAFVRAVPHVAVAAAGVSSTAPCPPDVARGVTAAGLTRLIEVYGSSETAGIGRRDDPAAPFTLLAGWRRGLAPGELIRVRGGVPGETVNAPDRLDWVDARRLRPVGRSEGAVQVGGVNVFPARIAERLSAQPGVAAAAVRLMRPAEGDRLKAFVVPAAGAGDPALLRERLFRWIDAELSAPERPKSIAFGAQLPTGELGKSADWPLPQTPADESEAVR